MKELYISPELQVMSFAPVENLAFGSNLNDGFLNANNLMRANGAEEGAEQASGDLSLKLS